MRPGKYDRKYQVLIKGAELIAGIWRPCWMRVALSLALHEPDDSYSPPLNKRAIKKLLERLQAEYESAYGKDGMGVG